MRDGNPMNIWKGESASEGDQPEDSADYDKAKPRQRGGQHGQPVFDFYGPDPTPMRK